LSTIIKKNPVVATENHAFNVH